MLAGVVEDMNLPGRIEEPPSIESIEPPGETPSKRELVESTETPPRRGDSKRVDFLKPRAEGYSSSDNDTPRKDVSGELPSRADLNLRVGKDDTPEEIWEELERLRGIGSNLREELTKKEFSDRGRSSSKRSNRSNSSFGNFDEFTSLRSTSKVSVDEDMPISPGSDDNRDMLVSKVQRKSLLKRSKSHSLEQSAAGFHSYILKVVIFVLALGGVFFVLIAKATEWGADDAHRRLGGAAPKMLEMIAYCLTGVGILTFFVNLTQQPLILGYLLGGVLVGPHCLDIVKSPDEITLFSSLGLVFLLFMVGLELDVRQLAAMGRVVLVTGMLQFPVCVSLHFLIFKGLSEAGVDFGAGDKAVFYVALVCGISSTMIVAKLLAENADMDSNAGRLTIGILIFQDIWAIIVLAVQPDLEDPKPGGLLKTFAMILLLGAIAMLYAKFVMPVVFLTANKNVELMLVIALCWCFFLCCFATLPKIGLSMELAALVSGVALAAYPYTAELNGKIKYIRDFFITIFFCGLGMQIPPPKPEPILTAVLIAFVVICVRWIGIFGLVLVNGGGTRLAAVATINLSEVSEFALVICSLGLQFEPRHIEEDTLTIMIWTFALCAVMAANLIPYNYKIYAIMVGLANKLRGKSMEEALQHEMEEHDHEDRNIVILGFHKIATVLVKNLQDDHPHILHRLHAVDFSEKTLGQLKGTGITTAFGDISSPDVLEHAVHTEPHLVLITVPDGRLRGTTNLQMLSTCKKMWPHCKFVATSDNPKTTEKLYMAGADYVVSVSCLCGDKLSEVLYAFTGTDHTFDDYLQEHDGSRPNSADSGEKQVTAAVSKLVRSMTGQLS